VGDLEVRNTLHCIPKRVVAFPVSPLQARFPRNILIVTDQMDSASLIPALNSSSEEGGDAELDIAVAGPGVGPAPTDVVIVGYPPELHTPPPPLVPSDRCSHALLDLEYHAATAIICSMYLVFGVVYSIFGKIH
jgi:hypothetical protein